MLFEPFHASMGARPIFDALACVPPDDVEDRDAESKSSGGNNHITCVDRDAQTSGTVRSTRGE